MAIRNFQGSKIIYLSLEQASNLHPIWQQQNLNIPLNAIEPQGLIDLLGMDYEDDWIEWLMLTQPIVLVEKLQKAKAPSENLELEHKETEYLRIMGHSTFYYLVHYIGLKNGSIELKDHQYPMMVIPQKKLSRHKTAILNTELVFSYLLQRSKQHREIMQNYLMNNPAAIPKINSHRQISKFAKISHSSLQQSKEIIDKDEPAHHES